MMIITWLWHDQYIIIISLLHYYYIIIKFTIITLLLHYYYTLLHKLLLHIITNSLLRIITSLLYHYYIIITSLLQMENHVIMIPLLRFMQRVGLYHCILIMYYDVIITRSIYTWIYLILLLPILTYFSIPNLQMKRVTLKGS